MSEDSRKEPELLLSFFTRNNPEGDQCITHGHGPTIRSYAPEFIGVKNYDTVIETRKVPFVTHSFDIVSLLSPSDAGKKWLGACEKYLGGFRKPMPEQIPFAVEVLQMKKEMFYYQDLNRGPGYSPDYADILQIPNVPEGMIFGKFMPEQEEEPWKPVMPADKIGMACNGGVIFPDNRRGGYTIQPSTCSICLSCPATKSLLGDMRKGSLKDNHHDYEFPRTHFLEWIFARHCVPEPNPMPGIRIELSPENPNNTTFKREARWIEERQGRDLREGRQLGTSFFENTRHWPGRPTVDDMCAW